MNNPSQKPQIIGEVPGIRIPPSPPLACGAHCTESPSRPDFASHPAQNPSPLSHLSHPSRDISGTWGDLRANQARRGIFLPPGYLLLPDWARTLGRSTITARVHLRKGHLPEAIRVGRTQRFNAVPEGLPWPAKANGRPRKVAA